MEKTYNFENKLIEKDVLVFPGQVFSPHVNMKAISWMFQNTSSFMTCYEQIYFVGIYLDI